MWTNQIVPHRYSPPTLLTVGTTIGTNPTGSNESGIACPERTVAIKATRTSTSTAGGDTDHAVVDTADGRTIKHPVGTTLEG
jgi:hypothetical protein